MASEPAPLLSVKYEGEKPFDQTDASIGCTTREVSHWIAPGIILFLDLAALFIGLLVYQKSDPTPSGILLILLILLCISIIGITIFGSIYTQRIKAEVAESREHLQIVTGLGRLAIWEWNSKDNLTHWEADSVRLFGYTGTDFTQQKSWLENQIHPEDRDRVMACIRQAAIDGEKYWAQEYRVRRKDGTYAQIQENGLILENHAGKGLHYLGVMSDISQYVEIIQRLRQERELFTILLDNIPDDVYAKDTQSRFLYANPAVTRLMGGTSPADLIGKTDFDFYPYDLANKYYNDEQRIVQTGLPLINEEEIVLDKITSDLIWNSAAKIPIKNNQGEITMIVGIGRHITARKQVEEALKQTNEQLTQWVEELEWRTREITLLNDLSGLMQTCPTTEEAYKIITEIAQQLFADEAGALYMISPSRNVVEQVVSWGEPITDPAVFEPSECWGLRLGKIHTVEKSAMVNNRQNKNHSLLCHHIQAPEPESSLCMPLVAQGEALGVLHIRHSHHGENTENGQANPPTEWFTEAKQQLIHTVADSLALALANLKLRETLRQQSIRDPLTGLFNRRYLEESLEREVRRAARSQRSLGVIMMDIDHFKHFNDTFGHDAGDTLLRELGVFLRSQVRGEDIACRYGGEEFAIVLPDTTLQVVEQRAEKLREGIKHLNVMSRGKLLGSVSISAGVAAFPEHGGSGEAVIRTADAALFKAKQAGRDRVTVAAAL